MAVPIPPEYFLNIWTGFATYVPPDPLSGGTVSVQTLGGIVTTTTVYPGGVTEIFIENPDDSFTFTRAFSDGAISFAADGYFATDMDGNHTAAGTETTYDPDNKSVLKEVSTAYATDGTFGRSDRSKETIDHQLDTTTSESQHTEDGSLHSVTTVEDASGNTDTEEITITRVGTLLKKVTEISHNGVVVSTTTEKI